MSPDEDRPSVWWTAAGWGILIGTAIVAFLFIRTYGERLLAPPPEAGTIFSTKGPSEPSILVHVLMALAAVIVLGQLLARVFAYVGQPPVIGEVMAGILLGPSFIGIELSRLILPSEAAPFLNVIAQLGVILYMFLVGLELNADELRVRAHATVITSHASIVVPFVLGAWLALGLYPRLSTSDVPFTSFALFMGIAMSITAFPVLARILSDRGLAKTELGLIALGCAASGDVTAWCLLAFVVGVAQAELGEGFRVASGALVYIALMFFVARPIVKRLLLRVNGEHLSRGRAAFVFVGLLLSTLATEVIGIHAVFGAFLLGAIIPHDSAVAQTFTRQLESLVTVFFLPAFFAFTGMRTRIDLVTGLDAWLMCGLIILFATLGKFGGTFIAARLTGLGWRDGATLGTLMNTRGLMELIVLGVGLDLGVISPPLFAMMVLMALVTTMATAPVLRVLLSPRDVGDDEAERMTVVPH